MTLDARHLVGFALAAGLAASCGGRTGLVDPPATAPATDAAVDVVDVVTCPRIRPVCVAVDREDPCGRPQIVSPICDAGLLWACPPGSWEPHRGVEAPPVCRPFSDPGGPIRALGGSLARVPTDDGRCLWIGEDVTLSSGQQLRNVAFEVDPTAPPGTCPTRVVFAGGRAQDVVTVEGGDPSLVVQVTGAYRLGGATHVTYRLFRFDGGPHFGLTELGTGLGRWDAATQHIVVPGPAALRFGTELDLGDASWVSGDRAYVWGCPAPIEFLTEHCVVARLDAMGSFEVFAGDARWTASTRRTDAATVFDAGPWVSSVAYAGTRGRLAHVFAVGFGRDLQMHTAAAPEGPWTPAASVARCDVPRADAHAFCAGPVVHLELADPTRPGELPITYGLGSTEPGATPAETYWSRLQWVTIP